MKLLFFTDPHYSATNLSCRKDDYPTTMLDKTRKVILLAEELGCDLITCGGDFGHTKRLTVAYLNQLFTIFKSSSIPMSCIIGNHDEYYGDPRTVEKSPLGAMFTSHVFMPRPGEWVFENDEVIMVFMPFMLEPPTDFTVANPSGKATILFAHYFFPGQYQTEILPMNYTHEFDYIFLGHDHDTYPIERHNRALIIRPGALSRGTRVQSNWDRPIQVAYLDTETKECSYMEIESQPAEQIFSKERILVEKRLKESQIIDELSKSIALAGTSDVLGLLEAMEIEEGLKKRTVHWMKEFSIL